MRHYILFYPTVDALTADQWLVQADGGSLRRARQSSTRTARLAVLPGGGRLLRLDPPDDQKLVGDLHFERGTQQINSLGYFDFLNRLAPDVAYLESTGEWYDPHPWWNMFLPSSATDAFVSGVMAASPRPTSGSGVICDR